MKQETDSIQVQILGSGTILSGAQRQCASYLINHQNRTALLDAGMGAVLQLKKARQNPLKITEVFISHFHLDHTADLFPFLLWRCLQDPQANSRLTLYGPPGTTRWFADLAAWQGGWLSNARPQIIEAQGAISWAGLKVTAQPTPHTEESIAWRFGDLLFYSGDTDWSDKLVAFAKGCRCGLVECSFPDTLKMAGHLTTSESARLAGEAHLTQLVLTHFYPQNERQDLELQVKRIFNGQVIAARDLLTVEIGG